MLETLFSLYGTVESCKVATGEKGSSKGFGFVQMDSEVAALAAIEALLAMSRAVVELNVSGISLSDGSTAELDLRQLGFFLTTHDAWIHVVQQVHEKDISCALRSGLVKVVYSFDRLNSHNHPSGVSIPRNGNFNTTFQEKDPGEYALIFTNCLSSCRVSMTVRSAMYNLDTRKQHRTYLSVGYAALPLIYLLFFLAYAALAAAWVAILLHATATFSLPSPFIHQKG